MRFSTLTRFALVLVAMLLIVSKSLASPASGYLLDVLLRSRQETDGQTFVVTFPLDDFSARQILDEPSQALRPHLTAARKAYARNRGYEGPAFRKEAYEILPITGWRWRLRRSPSGIVLAEGSNRPDRSRDL